MAAQASQLAALSSAVWQLALEVCRDISRPEAKRLIAGILAAFGVMRCPARRVLKQADGANLTVRAEVEPVMRAARHTDQITGFDFDGRHWPLSWMNVKQAAPGDDEAHFVFIMPVLALEARQHRIETRRLRSNVNHVDSHIAAA